MHACCTRALSAHPARPRRRLIHTAWTGSLEATLHNKSSVRRDYEALLDSFLMTQDLKRTKFIFWWMDHHPTHDAFAKQYAGRGNGAIEFRTVDFPTMAKGTPLESINEVLTMGQNLTVVSKNKRPRQLANMFRTLALFLYGGIWIDCDTLLLRDMRPLLEYSGEFATQLAWANLYNNNFMGLRAHSPIGWDMLNTIARTGLPPASGKERDMKEYCNYVTQFGGLCYGVWYWNHGSIQRTVFQDRGLVPFPTTYSDPGYQGCYAPYLMGFHGGLSQTGLSIQEILQLLRGTFIIHTRAYNAKKPMDKNSNFYQLYQLFRAGAEKEDPNPVPAFTLGRLGAEEQAFYNKTWAKRLSQSSDVNRWNMIEPPWYPAKPRSRVALESVALGTCLAGKKKGLNELGKNPPVDVAGNCPDPDEVKYSRPTWAWNPGTDGTGGHLRPWSIRGLARPLCLDGDMKSAYGRRAPHRMDVGLVGCTPERRSQKWVFVLGRLLNMDSKLCLQAVRLSKSDDRMSAPWREAGDKDTALEMVPCADTDAQKFKMVPMKEHLESRFGVL